MHVRSESLIASVRRQRRKLEKRDWELWTTISVTGVLASFTILAFTLPRAFLTHDGLHFEVTISRSLAAGLVVLVLLSAHYLVVLSPHLKSLSRRLRRFLLVNAEGETVGV